MKLMLIDGNSIVNRAFYGIRMLNAPDGTPTNGIYGFLTILQRLLDEENPDAVCVAFDVHAPTFRHLRYAEYKGTRKGMPEELRQQMPVLKQVLDAMGIARAELEGWEADDLLGTLSRRCEAEGQECVIVTGDKDSLQLITEKTRVLHVKTRMGQTETVNYTPARFTEEYGFAPLRMIDLKALMGDSSDNIPGVPGVGEKTAMALVQTYGALDAIYADPDALDVKPGVRKKLVEGEESARMSLELATIRCDAPIEFDLTQACWSTADFKPALYGLFLRLGFTKLIEKYKLTPGVESAPVREFAGECKSVVLRTAEDVQAAAAALAGKTACVYSADGITAVNIDDAGGATAYILCEDAFDGNADAAFCALLAPEVEKIGHNTKDIIRRLVSLGQIAEPWAFDTALAGYLLDATAGSYDITRLCVTYCGFEPYRAGKADAQTSLFDGESAEERIGEAASMAAAIACLRDALDEKLRENGCDRLYYEVELPLCAVLAEMERNGFLVDREALRDFGESMVDAIDALQKSIWSLAGTEFNINSPKQLGEVLFERLMLPGGKKTKTGWSTNADTLEKLRDKHPIVNEVMEYRMLTKLKSTYADGLLKVIDPDGRIRTSFQMTVTATGRLSSTEPNLQNIPVRREFGAQIRKMFVAAPGMVLVDADYSQIELRLLAHISGDETMIEAFRSGEDIHAVTASQVFGVPTAEVTHQMRSNAKAVNFGIVYGISAWSLAQDIGVSNAEAKAYMDAYLEKYHGVRDYQKSVVEQARADGYAVTLYGRRRALPELKSSNFAMRSFGERVALNMPVQGTAADVIKLAMVRVHARLKSEKLAAKLILQVHDELIVECPECEAEQVRQILTEEMCGAAALRVPLTADAGLGKSWAEAH
ncbi:MAG: DNA polymerase I [Ruminococcaceae bacterium]|nr:DNA polymerase I [Oscillospiraceae bacterium]